MINALSNKNEPEFQFQISRKARRKYQFDESLFSIRGQIVFANFNAARRFAEILNSSAPSPGAFISASDLNAMGLLDEVMHYIIEVYRKEINPDIFNRMESFLIKSLGRDAFEQLLHQFVELFPAPAVYKGQQTTEAYLQDVTGDLSNRHVVLAEMLLLWLDNNNPAYQHINELIDDRDLKKESKYASAIDHIDSFLSDEPPIGEERLSLFEFLSLPGKKFPNSLNAQLEYIKTNWSSYLGQWISRILIGLDFIREEQKMRFDPAVFGPAPTRVTEFFPEEEIEPERFSPDLHWMPKVVLLAKSTYVWLHQLSNKYARPIKHLDQIPDEELDLLSKRGFTALWLIGLWQRSHASKKIKRMSGNPEAIASAYSLYDYIIADDLGGEEAYYHLKERAWRRGIRLASDMVPNHMAIDSRWLIQHPDWFLQLDESPFPGYTFTGEDLCDDERISVYIEDGYWNRSDAAVVFKRVDRHTGAEKYIYHGNDGTSMPWNDTAQLNFLIPEVREAVIQTILHVARKFPIIRFDAAMTLAKKHYQRLWFPQPGQGGDIPSRAEHGMTKSEFDRVFPKEFWMEVVERIQNEVPDTLLLAEAFWMMEGYFVRSLGMHRVYNSAFMNMLKNEENAKYRQSIKNVLEFNPQILKRYVNFMNNPDEDTAVAQFGKDDKYFGVCVLMSTMPGLPMFGHGQIEGFTEKYGMEYSRSYWDEEEDSWLISRHEREIFPLLRRRYLFSDVENFLLYDFFTADGTVNENVFAFSNRTGDEKSLVIYNNKFDHAAGWIKRSTAYLHDNQLKQSDLADGLGIPWQNAPFVTFRDSITGLEYIRSTREIHESGLYIELGAFKYHVFLDFRLQTDSSARPYGRLYNELNGRGVSSLETALGEMMYRPILEALEPLLSDTNINEFYTTAARGKAVEPILENYRKQINALLQAVHTFENIQTPLEETDTTALTNLEHLYRIFSWLASIDSTKSKGVNRTLYETFKEFFHVSTAAKFYILPTLRTLGRIYAHFTALTGPSEFLYARLIDRALHKRFKTLEPSSFQAQLQLQLIDILLYYPDGLAIEDASELSTYIEDLINYENVQRFLVINRYEDVVYFNKERFEILLFYLFVLRTVYLLEIGRIKRIPTANAFKQMQRQVRTMLEKARQSRFRLYDFLNLMKEDQPKSGRSS